MRERYFLKSLKSWVYTNTASTEVFPVLKIMYVCYLSGDCSQHVLPLRMDHVCCMKLEGTSSEKSHLLCRF